MALQPSAQRTERVVDGVYDSPEAAVARYDRGRRLIAEYFGGSWDSLAAKRDSSVRRRLMPLRFTIVTIPDPYDSHMDWSYDANLEALRRAMGTAGYVPHNFWLPARSDSIRVTVDGVTERRAAHDYQPGVFLFRSRNVDAPALHLVYLVPELPTAGVHMMAFRAALAERKTIMGADSGALAIDRRERAELSVLGPNFSGSALSLRALVEGGIAARTDTVPPFTARVAAADLGPEHAVAGRGTGGAHQHAQRARRARRGHQGHRCAGQADARAGGPARCARRAAGRVRGTRPAPPAGIRRRVARGARAQLVSDGAGEPVLAHGGALGARGLVAREAERCAGVPHRRGGRNLQRRTDAAWDGKAPGGVRLAQPEPAR